MVWSEEEATKYAEVLTDCDNKDRSWLYQLENCALKKQANEELFGEIKPELEDALQQQHLRFSFDDQHLNSHFSEN